MRSESDACMKKITKSPQKPSIKYKLDSSLQFDRKKNQEIKKLGRSDMKPSDGPVLPSTNTDKILQQATGTSDNQYGSEILSHISSGLQGGDKVEKLARAARVLPVLRPQDETEAMLVGQFFCLQEAGNKYLRLAGIQDGFYHVERYVLLANKLFNTANQTMQTLIKYRSKGQQVVQVVHLHNQGQAIVTQNLSHLDEVGGSKKKM